MGAHRAVGARLFSKSKAKLGHSCSEDWIRSPITPPTAKHAPKWNIWKQLVNVCTLKQYLEDYQSRIIWDIWGKDCLLVGRNGTNGFKNHWEQVSADNTGVHFLHYLCDWPATSTHVAVPALRICLLFRVERIDQYLIISSIFLTEKKDTPQSFYSAIGCSVFCQVDADVGPQLGQWAWYSRCWFKPLPQFIRETVRSDRLSLICDQS